MKKYLAYKMYALIYNIYIYFFLVFNSAFRHYTDDNKHSELHSGGKKEFAGETCLHHQEKKNV